MIKLARIVLVNWYAFGVQDVDLRGSTAIIGPNGAGKSSLLDAVQGRPDRQQRQPPVAQREQHGHHRPGQARQGGRRPDRVRLLRRPGRRRDAA